MSFSIYFFVPIRDIFYITQSWPFHQVKWFGCLWIQAGMVRRWDRTSMPTKTPTAPGEITPRASVLGAGSRIIILLWSPWQYSYFQTLFQMRNKQWAQAPGKGGLHFRIGVTICHKNLSRISKCLHKQSKPGSLHESLCQFTCINSAFSRIPQEEQELFWLPKECSIGTAGGKPWSHELAGYIGWCSTEIPVQHGGSSTCEQTLDPRKYWFMKTKQKNPLCLLSIWDWGEIQKLLTKGNIPIEKLLSEGELVAEK